MKRIILVSLVIIFFSDCFGGKKAPSANFSADKTNIKKGQSVTFNDLSTNEPDRWDWKFQGGMPSTSNIQNPVIRYDTAGVFYVELTAGNSGGETSRVKMDFITVTN